MLRVINDDDRSIREVVAATLHLEDYRVDSALSGTAAMELLTVRTAISGVESWASRLRNSGISLAYEFDDEFRDLPKRFAH